MSPAGHWPQLHAAIEAGADAVYFGLNHFSARAKVGFQADELPDVVAALHERGVKAFVTFNTLVFDSELNTAEKAIIKIAESGADAMIVQDPGIALLTKKIAPHLDIHGSTQMSITSAQGAEFAHSLGCSRVVLGRELSLKDIAKIAAETDVELEVFVHGALCVSYSGQCFSSEAWGGRSANRGKCAQACRLSYKLEVDGQLRDLGSDRYLLSPGDLYTIEQIPELISIGVACLKIEGRYKDENYVALTTAAYRQAIDQAAGSVAEATPVPRESLEQIYSRGLGPHFLAGVNHQEVVKARAPRHRGVLVGKVVQVHKGAVDVQLDRTVQPGDGLVFDAADWRSPDEPEEGGNVFHVDPVDQAYRLSFRQGTVDFQRIRPGDLVWRTNEPQLLVQLKPVAKPKSIQYTRPLDIHVTLAENQPVFVQATDGDNIATVTSESLVTPARNQSLTPSRIREQLERLGGTPFHVGSFQCEIPKGDHLFLPVSQLNAVRRQLVDKLIQQRRQQGLGKQVTTGVIRNQQLQIRNRRTSQGLVETQLHLLIRHSNQLDEAIAANPSSITLDYLELYGLRPSVEKIRAAGICPRVASPRILKPSEQNVIRFLLSLECPVVVRSSGLLNDLLKQVPEELPELIGDFSLNATNAVSTSYFLEQGLTRITPGFDLNARQIEELGEWIAPGRLEVVAYSHLPVFHTEHCVFCRFLSQGTDHTNCGHPCEKHQIALEDQQGRRHPVMADVGCRNTVFGSEAQVSLKHLRDWQQSGIAHFRVEFVHETPGQVADIAAIFDKLLDGKIDLPEATRLLESASPAGTTLGSLYVPQESVPAVHWPGR